MPVNLSKFASDIPSSRNKGLYHSWGAAGGRGQGKKEEDFLIPHSYTPNLTPKMKVPCWFSVGIVEVEVDEVVRGG